MSKTPPQQNNRSFEFSLFFFSADGASEQSGKYDLLMESARFADQRGFTAVWTPERHFQQFGGLYPNPSVLGAALAMVTNRLQIRAGSVVLPLHNPVRMTEEWSLLDNLSGGRVGVALASGWHRHDYVLAPGNFHRRREIMFEYLETVRQLWSGKSVTLTGPDEEPIHVRTLPRPIQSELPVWITASSPQTWTGAARHGSNILTMLRTSPAQLADTIRSYRQTLAQHGHDPRLRKVTLMLHTYVTEDVDLIRDKVRAPLKQYLANFLDQFKPLGNQNVVDDGNGVGPETLLDFSFERYLAHGSLIGSRERCLELLRAVKNAGVDEVACLIDFGLDPSSVRQGLIALDQLREEV